MSIERVDMLLSVQRALLGAIGASLRAIAVRYTEISVTLIVLADNEWEPEQQDALEVALTEIVADFPQIESVGLLRKPSDWRGDGAPLEWVYKTLDLRGLG
jgi:hypothetical protein